MVIGIITTIITLLIIALEVMIGYERGIRKNIFRMFMLILVAVLTLYITPPVVELVVRELIITNKLYDFLYGLTGVNPSSYLFIRETAVNMFDVFLNPFVYVVLFWILKLISFGIYLLLDRYIMNKKFNKLFPSPNKRSSIAGGVLGGLYAVLIGAVFFMPISAYSELLQKTEESMALIEGQEGTVSDLLGDNYRFAISYKRTPSYYFYKYTGSQYLGDAMFSSLSKKETDLATVSVERYLTSIIRVYDAAKRIYSMNQGKTSYDLERYVHSMSVIVDEFARPEIVSGTDMEKLALLEDILQTGSLFGNNTILNTLTQNMDYETLEALELDMKHVTELMTLLQEKDILSDILEDKSDITSLEVMDKLDDEFIVRIADKLYSMEQAEYIVPMITEKLLALLLEDGGVSSEVLEQIENFGDTKQEFIEVCKSGKQLAYLMNYDVEEERAREFLEESLAVIRASKLIRKDTLEKLEQSLSEKLKKYQSME